MTTSSAATSPPMTGPFSTVEEVRTAHESWGGKWFEYAGTHENVVSEVVNGRYFLVSYQQLEMYTFYDLCEVHEAEYTDDWGQTKNVWQIGLVGHTNAKTLEEGRAWLRRVSTLSQDQRQVYDTLCSDHMIDLAHGVGPSNDDLMLAAELLAAPTPQRLAQVERQKAVLARVRAIQQQREVATPSPGFTV